jgi:hypothetical protein
MTSADIASIVDQINAVDRLPCRIVVTGGEPTLHSECVGFCKYIKDHIIGKGGEFLLDTNFSNPDVNSRCEEIGFAILDYKGSRDPDALRQKMANEHFNIYLSPKVEHIPADSPSQCRVLNGVYGGYTCGISVHRFRGSIRWCWCSGGSSLCKLLQHEEFLFGTLKELLKSDVGLFRKTVCPHCMYLANNRVYARDSVGHVSSCFTAGLEAMKAYNDGVNKAQQPQSKGI